MVLEALVKKTLAKYFKIFLKNFQEDDFSLTVTTGVGEAHLMNIGEFNLVHLI
jgi:hypothetical protein